MSKNEESTASGEEESITSMEELFDSDSEKEVAFKPKKPQVVFNKKYLMNCSQRPRLGQAVIFNNQNFDDRIRKLKKRF